MDKATQKGSQKQNKQKKEYKKALVVNDQDDFDILLTKLSHIAENKIPVAVDPNFLTESVFAEIRQYNHFATIEYNPNAMSHMILKIMPQMQGAFDALTENGFESFSPSTTEKEEDLFEYPEDQ